MEHYAFNPDIADALEKLSNSISEQTKKLAPKSTSIYGLTLYRSNEPKEPHACMYEPSICLVAQGSKSVTLGGQEYIYDPKHYLLSSLDLPGMVKISDASSEKPYLGLVLKINLQDVTDLILNHELPLVPSHSENSGISIAPVTLQLINAFQRLLDLLNNKQDIPILAPAIQKEILYRILMSEQGQRLRQIVSIGSTSYQIAQSIEWLKKNFTYSFSVQELAAQVNMSTSSFHQHFKTITATTPLQFQKQLRLQEARRLMFEDRLDAATASFQVGYESPSQFNREYTRLFGLPPLQDITKLHDLSFSPLKE